MRPEVAGTPGKAAFHHHRIQAGSGESGILRQGLQNERCIGICYRRTAGALGLGHAGPGQDAIDGGMVNTQLVGNGVHAPVLHEVVAQNLCLAVFIHCRCCLLQLGAATAAPGVACLVPAGAKSGAAGMDRRGCDRYGSAGSSGKRVVGVEPACALCCAVEQGRLACWNRDALLCFADAPGTGAGVRRYCVGLGGLHYSADRLDGVTQCGQDQRNHRRSRPAPDHSDGR